MFVTSQIAEQLRVNQQTVRNWSHRTETRGGQLHVPGALANQSASQRRRADESVSPPTAEFSRKRPTRVGSMGAVRRNAGCSCKAVPAVARRPRGRRSPSPIRLRRARHRNGDTTVMRIVHDPRRNGCTPAPFLVAPTRCRLWTVSRAVLARVLGRELRWGQWLFSRTLRSLRANASGWPAYPDSPPRKPPWWLGNTVAR